MLKPLPTQLSVKSSEFLKFNYLILLIPFTALHPKSLYMSIRSLLFAVGFSFLFLLLAHSWDKLQVLFQNIDLISFLISIFIGILGNFLVDALFQQLLAKYGIATSYSTVCQLFFFAQITKYIPGKIWALWYQATLLKSLGSPVP
ncbi:MAG: hypothetical protein R3E08_12745 [Thiotrichaceae bacterium]